MADFAISLLRRQLTTAWSLLDLHLTNLTDAEALWRPASTGLHVWQYTNAWTADWPEHEGYGVGPPSIAWLTWHIGFWWEMVTDHSFGDRRLMREDVVWPGSAPAAADWIGTLHERWTAHLTTLGDDDLANSARTQWPMRDAPFGDVVAWVNLELMKNAAEIGYVRFLYAASITTRPQGRASPEHGAGRRATP